MTESLYERYKDALRRGHVAALRGRLDAALVAYGEAAELARDRPLPHASIGAVLLRLGRPDDALAAYSVALDRAPRDETSLAGRADVLIALGRPVEAADALDRLAAVQDAAGRLSEAADTARRALELAESKARRRQVEAFARRLREVPADDAAAAALERVLGMLEPTRGSDAGADRSDEPRPAAPAEGGDAGVEGAVDGADPVRLAGDAQDRLDEGDIAGARTGLLGAAIAHRAAGEIDAALDACYLALAIAPGDTELHLVLAELYLDRGWRGPATEKLLLLDRLSTLGEDGAAHERICALVAARLPDEPRLAAVCS